MGTWGTGPFSNDTAADFLGDLAETDAAEVESRMMAALRLPADGYVEGPEADEAIVVAALAASKRGYVPPDGAELAADVAFEDSEELRTAAATALRRVQGPDSEWAELWEEAGELPAAVGMLDEITQHLS